MSDPVDLAPPPTESRMVSVRVSLFEDAESVARLAHAIALAGGRVRTLSTLRTLPDVDVVELQLSVEHLDGHAVAKSLKGVRGIVQVAARSGATMLDRRQTRIGGRVRWPEGRAAQGRQR